MIWYSLKGFSRQYKQPLELKNLGLSCRNLNDELLFTFKMNGFSTVDNFLEKIESVAETIEYIASEPSVVDLLYVQKHTQDTVPNIVNLSNRVAQKFDHCIEVDEGMWLPHCGGDDRGHHGFANVDTGKATKTGIWSAASIRTLQQEELYPGDRYRGAMAL